MLVQRGADALRHTALNLAVHDGRVDDRAAVLHHDVAQQRDVAGFDVHLDRGHVRGVGVRDGRRLVRDGDVERGVFVGRQAAGVDDDPGGQLADGDDPHRAFGPPYPAFGQLQVLGRDLGQARGDPQQLVAQFVRGGDDRAAAGHGAAAGPRPPAARRGLRVALHDGHVLDRDAERVGHELGVHGVMPLAVRMRADEDADLARLVDAHTRHFVAADLDAEGVEHRGVVRRALDVGPDADPEIPAALASAALSGAKVGVAENVERLLQRFPMAAAFDLGAHDGGVRMFVRGDHVPQPDVGRVQAEFGRGHVQQALHDQHRNRHADPAVHADGRFVGGDRAGLQVVGRNLVRAGQRAGGVFGLEGRSPRIGRIPARVPEKPRAHPADRAVTVQRQFRGHDLMLGV